ncbi:MAG TPA: MoaD/ThiS family protein [Syntrophobacteraceae bacterium]|nr:MoaD/ThiS family protein [Syntrophobacteraceae bacterium]
MISVTYRNRQWSVPGNVTVRDLVDSLGLNPESVLVLKDDRLIPEKTRLGEDAEIKLISVVSGG